MENALPITSGVNVIPQPPLSYSYAAPVYAGCFPARGCDDSVVYFINHSWCSLFLWLKDVTVSIK